MNDTTAPGGDRRHQEVKIWPYYLAVVVLTIWGVGAPLWFSFSQAEFRIRAVLANETTGEFEYRTNAALSESDGDIDSTIEGIRSYYPSGTKQITGSTLDSIVERSRRQNIELLEMYAKSRRARK